MAPFLLEVFSKPQHPAGVQTQHPHVSAGGAEPNLGELQLNSVGSRDPPLPIPASSCIQCPPRSSIQSQQLLKTAASPSALAGGFWGGSQPLSAHSGGCSASPLTFLLNSFHQFHQQRRRELRRAELVLQIRERRRWRGRKRERRGSDPAQPPKRGWGTNNQRQSQHWCPEGRKTAATRPQPTQTPRGGCGEPIKRLRNQYGTG